MKIRMRNPEFPLYFIGELGFGIFLFLDSPYKVISLKEKCIMILICVTIWNIVFMISRMRIIIMDKNGCTVKLLLWKKTYKWEDLEIIREDCWNSGRLHLKGIVFSSRRMGKNGKVYSTKKIFQSLQFLNCFFIIFDDEDVENLDELEHLENIEIEAKYVANKIKKLIDSKYQVYDRKKEIFRDITYKDIAILLRSTKDKASIYEQELIKLDMPVFADSNQEYLDSIEIQTIMSLLKIIDNPMQDIPLVTV